MCRLLDRSEAHVGRAGLQVLFPSVCDPCDWECGFLRCVMCRRVDSSDAHAERAVLREQLDRAYDVLKLKRTEERNMVQDVAQVCTHSLKYM